MQELDILLTRYLERDYPAASPAERDAFVRILELQDPEIFGYLVGRATPDEALLRHVVDRLRSDDA